MKKLLTGVLLLGSLTAFSAGPMECEKINGRWYPVKGNVSEAITKDLGVKTCNQSPRIQRVVKAGLDSGEITSINFPLKRGGGSKLSVEDAIKKYTGKKQPAKK